MEGAQVDFENARWKSKAGTSSTWSWGPVAKNMIQAFFFDLQRVRGRRSRPDSTEVFRAGKAVVLGAGMMGAGIAYVCARAGIAVALKDVSVELAERGKDYSRALVADAVERGRLRRGEADAEGKPTPCWRRSPRSSTPQTRLERTS